MFAVGCNDVLRVHLQHVSADDLAIDMEGHPGLGFLALLKGELRRLVECIGMTGHAGEAKDKGTKDRGKRFHIGLS